jgi:hypothetical protein
VNQGLVLLVAWAQLLGLIVILVVFVRRPRRPHRRTDADGDAIGP